MKRASLHTLGCRLNNSETHIIKQKLEAAGYQIVPFEETADLTVINTCTVTANADSKCRNMIRSFIRKNPKAYTAIVGCYSQMGYKALSEIEGVDLIVGNQEKLNVLDYVKLGKNPEAIIIRDKIVRDDFSISFIEETQIDRRANLKIQDGCDFICSFCIIPQARGVARSRDMDNLMQEARSLVDAGAKEIILTGVNIGTYNYQGKSVEHVIENLNQITGLERLRISSIEPTTIPDTVFDWMNDPEHCLVPYLHIPLQSGSDRILKEMHRKYSRQEFMDYIQKVDESVKNVCIGTDILVGFPGETDKDFEDTCDVLIETPLSYSHVFPYSRRNKTPAARSENQVPDPIKKERSARLRQISARQNSSFSQNYLGQTVEVLFENQKDSLWPGYTENYIRVAVESDQKLLNQIHKVKLTSVAADFMIGEIVTTD